MIRPISKSSIEVQISNDLQPKKKKKYKKAKQFEKLLKKLKLFK